MNALSIAASACAISHLFSAVSKRSSPAASGFFVPAGTAFEMYETTLHYAPCGVDGKGFKDVIILPKGTNADITKNPDA